MTPLSKLLIVQWSGPLPYWLDRWLANTERIRQAGHGWDFLLDHDTASIRERIERLGVKCPPLEGRKLCDYRPALGEMYAAEVQGYDFWGHTDLDCVYGPLWEYVTDELLAACDVFSNDPSPWMCGPFSLYRTSTASHVFREHERWDMIFRHHHHYGFDERPIGRTLEKTQLRRVHRHWHGVDSMYFHFGNKVYPDIPGWPWSADAQVAA